MTIKLDERVICQVSIHREAAGVTYALIQPDGPSSIFAKRSNLVTEMCGLIMRAMYERLDGEEKANAAAS
jgi:hypothetical protein